MPVAEILFYHMTESTLEETLPTLLEKTVQRGWRAVVQSGSEERRDALDSHLWTFRDDAFLAHGTDRDPHAAHQPVLLTTAAGKKSLREIVMDPATGGFDSSGSAFGISVSSRSEMMPISVLEHAASPAVANFRIAASVEGPTPDTASSAASVAMGRAATIALAADDVSAASTSSASTLAVFATRSIALPSQLPSAGISTVVASASLCSESLGSLDVAAQPTAVAIIHTTASRRDHMVGECCSIRRRRQSIFLRSFGIHALPLR